MDDGTHGSATRALVVVANRLPVHRVDGTWQTSPGGLVRAMLGVLRDRRGAWVGWDGDTSETEESSDEIEASGAADNPVAGNPVAGNPAGESRAGESRAGDNLAGDNPADDNPAGDNPAGDNPAGDNPAGESGHEFADARHLHELADVNLVRVSMSADEFLHHYERISNGALWPLFHDAIRDSTFDAESWSVYRDVNERFATAAAGAAAPGATVWVHDYQLLLVPNMLRELRPDVSIGFFLHIPFPPQELFMRMPWREELLHGVLGADLIGFQRSVGAENFVALVKRLIDVGHNDDDRQTLTLADGRRVRVGTFPISIDVDEIGDLADRPKTAESVAAIRRRLGSPASIFLGVDRLDYTKGIDLRLASFGALLSDHRDTRGVDVAAAPDIVLVQIAVPGREGVDSYMEERRVVEQLVGDVNGEHATIGHPAVHYIRRSLTLEELIPLYLAADVMLVTPRRDGMNLVAKEFVAARRDDTGVLILSEFAGAADELTEAIVVNPHDPGAIQAAMQQALEMSTDEISLRMQRLRKVVAVHDVHAWARSFLGALTPQQPDGLELSRA